MRREDSFSFLDGQPPVTVAGVFVNGLLEVFRLVFNVPIQVVVQKAPIRTQQKRAASASHIDDAESLLIFGASQLRWAPSFNLVSDSLQNDVLDDVGRSVVDASGFAYFGFLLDLGLMSGREPNHLAQEPFVNGSKDFDRHDTELVGRTVREVQALENRLEDFVVQH